MPYHLRDDIRVISVFTGSLTKAAFASLTKHPRAVENPTVTSAVVTLQRAVWVCIFHDTSYLSKNAAKAAML